MTAAAKLRIGFMTRAQWGAAAERTAHLSRRSDRVLGVTFHHTTGANLGHTDTAQWARNIQQFCFGRGYGDIEYNAMIRAFIDPHDGKPRGVFVEGRSLRWVGAHATSTTNLANRTTVGVALMGDADEVLSHPELVPTVRGLVSLCWYFQTLYAQANHLGRPQRWGHKEWNTQHHGGIATACPRDSLLAIVHEL